MRSAWLGVLLLSACASGGDGTATAGSTTAVAVTVDTTRAAAGETVVTTEATPMPTATLSPTPSASSSEAPVVSPDGFVTTQAVVTQADGTTCELCLWLADTSRQRARGLMFVTDVGPADGMAFRYPAPHTGTFWMKHTVLPLSIAFFGPDGSFLESFDMEPCTTDSCPNYATPSDFLVAIEVPQGHLEGVGLVAGSRLALLDVPCDE